VNVKGALNWALSIVYPPYHQLLDIGGARVVSIKLNFIRPGKPIDNAFAESFNGRLRVNV